MLFRLYDRYPEARFYDLLDATLSAELIVRPQILREEVLAEHPNLVVIDEVQHVPPLLEQVHRLLENTATHFIFCGSSTPKLRRRSRNLLGGRAIDFHSMPLTTQEIEDVDLKGLRALKQENTPQRTVVVSLLERPRITEDGIEILP